MKTLVENLPKVLGCIMKSKENQLFKMLLVFSKPKKMFFCFVYVILLGPPAGSTCAIDIQLAFKNEGKGMPPSLLVFQSHTTGYTRGQAI